MQQAGNEGHGEILEEHGNGLGAAAAMAVAAARLAARVSGGVEKSTFLQVEEQRPQLTPGPPGD
jgi:hypothetical protein